MRILTYFLIFVLLAHGLVHLLGFAAYWPLAEIDQLPYKTTLLGGRWDVGPAGMRLFSLLWLLAAGLFVAAATGLLLDQAWAVPLLWVAVPLSLLLCLLDFGAAWAGALISGLVLVGLIALQGLRVQPPPLAQYPGEIPPLTAVAVPDDLPAPVARYYDVISDGTVPLVETAVFNGRGTMTINGITLPMRGRLVHDVGQDYRQVFQAAYYGRPIMEADEWYIDGHAVLNTPFGVVENDPDTDAAANLALWSFSMMVPSIYLTDDRVRWEPIDAHTARLAVPFDGYEDSFTVSFDPQTGLIQHMDTLRYADAEQGKRPWRAAVSDWQEIDGWLRPTQLDVIWLEDGVPWLTLNIEEMLFNVPVEPYLQEGETAVTG